jgi:hypothetical protein
MANLVLGATNTATKPTVLVVTPASGAFTGQFRVQTNHGTAVMGQVTGNNASAIGVVGDGSGPMSTGVFGQAEYLGVFGLAMGPGKKGGEGFGVFGEGQVGVLGQGNKIGVHGWTAGGIGVLGEGATAGRFNGDVVVHGSLTVTGIKSAASPHPDGSLRRLYALESPESWYEDFGRARLETGRIRVELDRDFAALIRPGHYHVFITPEAESPGLWVARRTQRSFEVRELAGGRGNASFSYRIVGRRKDVVGRRLEKVVLEETPNPPSKTGRPKAPNRRRGA